MTTSNLKIPGNIVFGEGSIHELKKLKGKKAIVVTGGSSMKKGGFTDQIDSILKEGGFETSLFDKVEQNPSVETVYAGRDQMLDFEPDWIIALGGGSSMDAAKAMWAFYEYPELTFEDILTPGTCPELRKKAKLCCIPSTSGTASEITAFSVITDTKKHIKYPLVSEWMVPDIAIIDPSIPAKMPKSITANTGMDVLVHATEAIVSSASNDYADALAIQAIKFIFKYLKQAYDNPNDMEAREKMHNASAMAGMAFTSSASLGIVHSMAHILGGRFGITHGLANAILLPYVTQFNRKATDKVAWIEEELRIDDFPTAVKELSASLDIPLTLKEAGFGLEDQEKFESELSDMSKIAQKDPCTFTNPRETTPEIIEDIYQHAYKGEDITD